MTNERRAILENELVAYNDELQTPAWSLLVSTATAKDVEVLQQNASGTWLEVRLGWLAAWVSSKHDIESVIAQGHDPALLPFDLHTDLAMKIARLSTEAIERLTNIGSKPVIRAAVRELSQRGVKVSEQIRLAAMARSTLADLLLASNPMERKSRDTDDARYVRLAVKSNEKLAQSLKWIDLESAAAYRILVERGHIDHETARADIATDFKRIHDSFVDPLVQLARLDANAGDEVQKMLDSIEPLRDFLAENFAEKALQGLSVNPTEADTEVARKMLTKSGSRSAAIRILSEVGRIEDVDLLVETAETSYDSERTQALNAVRRLINDDQHTFLRLLSSKSSDVRRFAVWLIRGLPHVDARKAALALLIHSDENMRLAAVVYLAETLSKTELEQTLDEYLARDEYYYNVVTWLDRFLYAPPDALRAYLTQVRDPWREKNEGY